MGRPMDDECAVIAVDDVIGCERLIDVRKLRRRRAELHHYQVASWPRCRTDANARDVQRRRRTRKDAAVELSSDLDEIDRDRHFLIPRKSTRGNEDAQQLALRTGHISRLC